MAASLRNLGVYLGLVEGDDYGDPDAYDRQPAQGEPAAALTSRARPHEGGTASRARVTDYSRPNGAEAREPAREPALRDGGAHDAVREWNPEPDAYPADYVEFEPVPYRITTLHPRTYNEAVTIGEHFRSGTPVIMNLSEMADADAKRLVDFAAGLTFGLHGRVERVTAKVFLLSPQNVTVTAQDKARIAENGFFNQS